MIVFKLLFMNIGHLEVKLIPQIRVLALLGTDDELAPCPAQKDTN